MMEIDMSIEKMSREQIDEALRKLAETKNEEDSLRCSACCYAPSILPPDIKEECVCDGCGGICYFRFMPDEYDSIVLKYQLPAKDFTSLGYDVSVKFYCKDGVEKETSSLAPIVFSFRINDTEDPVLSYPDYDMFYDRDYRFALDILNGATSLSEFAKKYRDRGLDGEDGCVYADKIRSIIGPLDKPNIPPEDLR